MMKIYIIKMDLTFLFYTLHFKDDTASSAALAWKSSPRYYISYG